MLAVIRLLHSALVLGVGAGGQLALDVQERRVLLHVPAVTTGAHSVSLVHDRVTSMLQVPGIVAQTPVAVQSVVVWMLHRRLTLAHWLSAVQLALLLLQMPATIGHWALVKHACPCRLQLLATFGQSALD